VTGAVPAFSTTDFSGC